LLEKDDDKCTPEEKIEKTELLELMSYINGEK
jgi:hypothetical protein